MKKLFYLFAVAVVAISLASCDKKKDEPTPTPTPTPVVADTILVKADSETAYYFKWTDATATDGWWQVVCQNAPLNDGFKFYFSLSNLELITEAAGTYTADDLDPDYSYIVYEDTTKSITFIDGAIIVAETEEKVTIKGDLEGTDGNIYRFDLTWFAPVASDMTFEVAQNEAGDVIVTPSNDEDLWDYTIQAPDTVAKYTAEYIAQVMAARYGTYYAVAGVDTIPGEMLSSYYDPGQYVLITWGISEAGMTTDAFTFDIEILEAAEEGGEEAPLRKVAIRRRANAFGTKKAALPIR